MKTKIETVKGIIRITITAEDEKEDLVIKRLLKKEVNDALEIRLETTAADRFESTVEITEL